jgi:5-methylcytosine-specific restriction protein A
MSVRRASKGGYVYGELPKGSGGRNICRKCGSEVPDGRRTFCSRECVHEWKLRTQPGYLRAETFKRDLGICAKCGIDTKTERQKDKRLHYSRRARGSGHLWQADHIKPVVEGGGECGLDNIRTLCTECHKRETAALANRRAEARKLAKPLPLLDA